jgi:C4-dicarboxylate-specific signal transduction histidine kinase
MFSQRLAKEALAIRFAADDRERRQRVDQLRKVLAQWSADHAALREDALATSNPIAPNDAVWQRSTASADELARAFEQIEPHFRRMQSAASRLIERGPSANDLSDSEAILASEAAFLEVMERIVGLYEKQARERIDRLIATTWVVTGIVLFGLAAIGRLVFRPAARLIDHQFAELRDARDALEIRVLERTTDLERVNRDLAREVRERSSVEERQRALVEQFSHVARTTTIGEMASGLAHELNQPLGAIANYTEGCLAALEHPDPPLADIRTVLGKILALTLRSGAIVQRIRRFVTRRGPTREFYPPDRLALEVEEFFRGEAERLGIALRIELAPNMPLAWGDPVQIQQVLVNLVRNALDAIPGSQTANPAVLIAVRPGPEGGVEFAVSDNGEGIPPDRIPRLFDAYFSTRDDGMGMGLAISRTIAEAHQGRIEVDSIPGSGTTFRVSLPAAGGHDERADGLHR